VSRGKETKARLLQNALQLMWLRGYGSMTIDEICERAVVSKGSFYHFFPDKAEVAAAALESYWDSIKPDFDRIFSSPNHSPVEKIEAYFDHAYYRQVRRKQTMGQVMGCPFAALGGEVSKHHSAFARKVRDLMKRYCAYFEGALREGQKLGHIQVEDPAAKARELFAYLEGSLTQARIHNDTKLIKNLSAGVRPMLGLGQDQKPRRKQKSSLQLDEVV
jgi:TetR/AcrR family transcriptional regulator, transcriptional repressor for nem operon